MTRSLFPLAAVLIACGHGPNDTAASNATLPDIQLLVSSLDFGELQVGVDPAGTYTFAIHNQGTAPLHIDGFGFDDDDAPFSVLDHGEPLVTPGGSSWVELAFDPQRDGSWETTLHIDSDDPDTPRAGVALQGRGLAPQIIVTPESWEPESTWIGCGQYLGVTVWNTGSTDLHVLEVEFTSATTELDMESVTDANGQVPGLLTVEPNHGATLTTVLYTPTDEVSDSGYLTITSDDPQQAELVVPITADSELFGTNTDSFEQRDSASVDVVVALDRSHSMSAELERLPDAFVTLTELLAAQGSDFRLAITTADNGCVNGPDIWIDDSFTSAETEATIEDMINLGGTATSNTERAFMLLEGFLVETPSGGCNEDFVRDDAVLHLMGVSDADEDSVNSWSHYVSLFQGYKADADDLVIHALGGDYPSGCDGAEAYLGMYEATVATGGAFLSICDEDWSTSLELLADQMGPALSHFLLSAQPVEATISVQVQGITSTHWSYEAEGNQVIFEQDWVPEGGDTIEIAYHLQPECE